MSGRIPQSFIDELLNRVDIVDVIDARVPLKKTGREYQACCPFHNEKTPSFTVSPGKQFYHCFGCGAGGNVIGFLMKVDGLTFPEAVKTLAMGLVIPMLLLSLVLRSPDSTVAVVLSLVPLFAPVLMFMRVVVQTPPLWQIALSWALILLSIWIASRMAGKLFRLGILMYGASPTWATLL